MTRSAFDILDAAINPSWKGAGWIDFELLRDEGEVVLVAGVTADDIRIVSMQWARATHNRRVKPGEPAVDVCQPHLIHNTPLLVETWEMALEWLAKPSPQVVALPAGERDQRQAA